MRNNEISYSIGAEALLWGIPVNLTIGQDNGKLLACGIVQWKDYSLTEFIRIASANGKVPINDNADTKNDESTAMSLVPKYKGDISLCYTRDLLIFGTQLENYYFKAAKTDSNFGIMFRINVENLRKSSSKNAIYTVICDVAGVLGLSDLNCYFHTGERNLYPLLVPNTGNSHGNRNEIYLEVCTGHTYAFYLKGTFKLSFLDNMLFHMGCSIDGTTVAVEAYSTVEKPIKLVGPFGIGNACLKIQLGTSNRMGMYANFCIGDMQLFCAMILDCKGSAIQPRMLSAAVSDISIQKLVMKLLGKEIDGISDFEFLVLEGLQFNEIEVPVSGKLDFASVVNEFNRKIDDKKLALLPENVQITPICVEGNSGYDMTDLRTMRHYFISNEGKVKLTAQFYYSDIDTTLGDYTVSKGVFICAALTVFGYRFETLLSYREDEGILAYARMPYMDLKFITIGPAKLDDSSMEFANQENLPISGNSVLAQLMPKDENGAVFFLSATKTDVSFYINGGINILGIVDINAKIYFIKGFVSIDVRKQILGLTMSLHLSVKYGDFLAGEFTLEFVLDATELTKKLESVKQNLEAAARRVHEKIENAKIEIRRAQEQVNSLYREIDYFDSRISGCRRAINDASWWKKAFVSIAMGIEIAAFEVAKGGVYAAIKVAQAALEVAQGIVSLSGYVSESVLAAANAVVEGVMSAFYIKFVRLLVDLKSSNQYFKAQMGFVALGKEYNLEARFGNEILKCDSLDKALETEINRDISGDVNEMGKINRSNWARYQKEDLSISDHRKRLSEVQEVMSSSMNLMIGMQEEYWSEFQTTIPEFERANIEIQDALIDILNIYETGLRTGDMKKYSSAMGGLKRQVANRTNDGVCRDEQTAKAKELIRQYDEARAFYNDMEKQTRLIMRCDRKMKNFQNSLQKKSREKVGKVLMESGNGDIKKVIYNTENIMYQEFPVNRSAKHYINISREVLIQKYFEAAYKESDMTPSEDIVKMRNRSRKGDYKSRL